MGGGGPCSRRRTRRRTWRPTTGPTAGRATFQRRRTTGSTSAATRSLRNQFRTNEREFLMTGKRNQHMAGNREALRSGCFLFPCFALLVELLGADECLARDKEVPATVI